MTVATRARWRVDSKSELASNENNGVDTVVEDETDGAGERGKTGEGGTNTGKVVVVRAVLG